MFGENSTLSVHRCNTQGFSFPLLYVRQHKFHRSFSYSVVGRILSWSPRSLPLCANTLYHPLPLRMGRTVNVAESHSQDYVTLFGKRDFTGVIKVHNQLASSLHQKECRKPSRQSYFSINISTKLPYHLPALQGLGRSV